MKRFAAFVYGVVCYGVFVATLLYAIGFLGNFGVPKSIDSGPESSMGTALAIDSALLAIFALQHSLMARPWFKQVWTRLVPEPVERSTYVLFSSAALLFLFWQWEPAGVIIWKIDSGVAQAVIQSLYAAGLLIVLLSTFMINHFDLFGLRQVYLYLVGRKYTHLEFRTPFFLQLCAASALFRMAADVLAGARDDGGSPVLCRHDHWLHSDSDPIRGSRFDGRSRRDILQIPQGSSHDCAWVARKREPGKEDLEKNCGSELNFAGFRFSNTIQ